jgi:transposase-like protein
MTSQDADGEKKGPRAGQRKRRTFTAAYKAKMLAEYDGFDTPGARGALLRREGLYHSHILSWRRAADVGVQAALTPAAGPGKPSPESAENRKLKKENARLHAELTRSKAAMEAMGKMHALLEMLSESADTQTP